MVLDGAAAITIAQPTVELLDPHVWTDATSRLNLRFALYDSLARPGPGGTFQPALATSWQLADDARTWTFHLRPGVRFHHGGPCTAADVVFSLERARGPSVTGELGTSGLYHSYLGGARLRAVNALRVEVQTDAPLADLLDLLVEIPILPEGAAPAPGRPAPGTGPYRAAHVGARQVRMVAFEEHWQGRPPAGQICWDAVAPEHERADRLADGRADLALELSPHDRAMVEARTGARLHRWQSHVCVIFMCNTFAGVCADPRIRKALNLALDVPTLIDAVRGGAASPLNGPVTPLHLGYDPETPPYDHDPDTARALLRDAGFDSGVDVVLDVPTTHPDEAPHLARLAAAQWLRSNVRTTIRTFGDRPGYAEMVKARRMDDLACFDSSPLSTWRVLREKFHSGVAGPWWQGYRNDRVDELLDQATRTADVTRRQLLYRSACRMIRDDAPWVFLYSPVVLAGVGAAVPCFDIDAGGILRFL